MSWGTPVMTLGALPINTSVFGKSGIGAVGEPAWVGVGYRHPRPTSPSVGQNLLRPTNKGCGCNDVGVPGLSPFGKVALGALTGKKTKGLGGAWVTDENGYARYQPDVVDYVAGVAGLAGAGMGIFHGYKRTGSAWGAVGYGLLGGVLPVVGIPVMLIQGFGKKKRRK